MTSSTKPKVHNALYCMTEPRRQVTCTENW